MSKKKSQRIQMLVELNANNEQQALQELGAIETQRQALQQQLEHLKSYRQEYLQKYQAQCMDGLNMKGLTEFRAFNSKLDLAIEEQMQAIEETNKKIARARTKWETLHHKKNGLQKVYQSAQRQEVKMEQKKEQNEQDDRASRTSRNNGIRNA